MAFLEEEEYEVVSKERQREESAYEKEVSGAATLKREVGESKRVALDLSFSTTSPKNAAAHAQTVLKNLGLADEFVIRPVEMKSKKSGKTETKVYIMTPDEWAKLKSDRRGANA